MKGLGFSESYEPACLVGTCSNAIVTTSCYLINCRTTCYIDQMGAWYDSRTKQEVMNLLILKQLQQAVGSFGLTGLDKLLSFMIVKELQVWKLFVYVMYSLNT